MNGRLLFTIERLQRWPGRYANSPPAFEWRRCDQVEAASIDAALMVAAATISEGCVLRVVGVSFITRDTS